MSEATRLIHGFHAVTARLRRDAASVHEIYLDAARKDARARDLARLATNAGVRIMHLDGARLDAMLKGARHQGAAARVAAQQSYVSVADVLDSCAAPPLLLALDGVTDPHNLGACLRVADAAGAAAVIAPKDRACGLNATAIKAASGAAESVPYIVVTNLARSLREIKEHGLWTLGAADGAASSLYSATLPQGVCWVLGAEGDGLRRLTRDTCDELVSIPMFGAVNSLNVSVAAAICLYETRRREA